MIVKICCNIIERRFTGEEDVCPQEDDFTEWDFTKEEKFYTQKLSQMIHILHHREYSGDLKGC